MSKLPKKKIVQRLKDRGGYDPEVLKILKSKQLSKKKKILVILRLKIIQA